MSEKFYEDRLALRPPGKTFKVWAIMHGPQLVGVAVGGTKNEAQRSACIDGERAVPATLTLDRAALSKPEDRT